MLQKPQVRHKLSGWLFVAPALVLLGIFMVWPIGNLVNMKGLFY
jgi:ABC-type sugar transport system permease subunit